MKCSKCKLVGYNKNNCPKCKEKQEEKFNRMLEILPFETAFVSIAYFSLSQAIQKQGTVADLLGSAGDLAAIKHPNAGIALGGMLSLVYEGVKEDTFQDAATWLEDQFGKIVKATETITDPLDIDIHKGYGFSL
tara:strand:+ start:35 stop:436 length:402 start_codon:yes stop_codon:yes gene_type:complete